MVVVVPALPPPQPGTSIVAPSNADHARALFETRNGFRLERAKNIANASESGRRPRGVFISGGRLIVPAVGAGCAVE